MKIAFIYDVIYPFVKGGAEKRNWEIAKRLSAKGHEAHLFGMKSWHGPSCIVSDGVYLHGICNFRNLYLKDGRRGLDEVLYFSWHLLPALWRLKFDVIDCNAFPYLPFFLVKIVAWFKNTALVITWQEVWGNYWYSYLGYFRGYVARVIERLVIKFSDNIIAHSLRTKRELLKNHVAKEVVTVIPHGVDFKTIENVPASRDSFDLLFVGRLIKDKNVDILINSVAIMKRQLPDISCLIVGEGPEKERLIGLTKSFNLEENIVFMDFLSYVEVISIMKSSRIFIFPSTREGFAIVVIEAMACGLPVIAVRHDMNAAIEFIKDAKNGFLCSLDAGDISSRALSLLGDKSLGVSFSRSARDSVREYSWDAAADKNELLYSLLINKS